MATAPVKRATLRRALPGTATKTVVRKDKQNPDDEERNGTTTKTEILEQQSFASEPARVRISHGGTYHLGNYETLRIDASVELPCAVEDVQKTYEKAADLAAAWVHEELDRHLPAGNGN